MSSRPQVPSRFQVAAFYAFTPLDTHTLELLQEELPVLAAQGRVLGSVLLAPEGVNGTISGPEEGVGSLLQRLRCHLDLGEAHFERFQVKYSRCDRQAFRRFKARRKKEIVTLGVPSVDPRARVGTYVSPSDWNAVVDDPDTLLIDTRNRYEVAIGSFEGAVDPGTDSFREFPEWVEKELRPLVERRAPARIAMFCTGGIRCEKASSFLMQKGFPEIHHLQGGILSYLEQIPESASRWRGECFVFDQRVALNHQLQPGQHRLCHACGLPLTPEQRGLESYIAGVQCLYCQDRFSDQDRERFRERQRQWEQQHTTAHCS